jgi:putative transposase
MDSKDYASVCKGLIILVNCLNDMIDSSGERDTMALNTKDRVVQAYERARKFLPPKTINKRLKISNQKISRWSKEKKCPLSAIKICYLSCPAQLTMTEQVLLKNYLINPDYSNLPRNHIWALARRKDLCVSLPTFYKYCRETHGKPKVYEIEKRETVSVHAKKIFQILHMDSTRITCKNGERIYVHFIMDNYSRKILGAVPSFSSKSEVVAENLKRILSKYHLYNQPFELYCDDGPENQGYVYELLKNDKRIKIKKIVARYEDKTSNNMIEYFNRKFKYVILRKFNPRHFDNLLELLPEMVKYNNNLFLPVLKTLTPNEVVKGLRYEDLDFKYKMQAAKRLRIAQNQAMDCEEVCLQET